MDDIILEMTMVHKRCGSVVSQADQAIKFKNQSNFPGGEEWISTCHSNSVSLKAIWLPHGLFPATDELGRDSQLEKKTTNNTVSWYFFLSSFHVDGCLLFSPLFRGSFQTRNSWHHGEWRDRSLHDREKGGKNIWGEWVIKRCAASTRSTMRIFLPNLIGSLPTFFNHRTIFSFHYFIIGWMYVCFFIFLFRNFSSHSRSFIYPTISYPLSTSYRKLCL